MDYKIKIRFHFLRMYIHRHTKLLGLQDLQGHSGVLQLRQALSLAHHRQAPLGLVVATNGEGDLRKFSRHNRATRIMTEILIAVRRLHDNQVPDKSK
jgi:hypothetical protein